MDDLQMWLGPVGTLSKVTYQIINLLIECYQASDHVRRSLELIRTCDRDLQHLITLREEHLDILERKPVELVRVNSIIEDAHMGLLDVARIIEKCRPDAHRGRMPVSRQLLWVKFDAEEFKSMVPVINSQHQSVLTEVQFLRLIALHVPPPVQVEAVEAVTKVVQKRKVDIGNVNLLIGIVGVKSVATPAASPYISDGFFDPDVSEPMSQAPPPRPPKPPLYTDPNYIATSSSKHISIADIQASRGYPSVVYDALWSAPHSPAANFNAIPPDVYDEWWSTGPKQKKYGATSQFPLFKSQAQNQGCNPSPPDPLIELAATTPHHFKQSISQMKTPIIHETMLDASGTARGINTAR